MAGTGVGAVYLDLKLNVKELNRGIRDVERDALVLGGVFEGLQADILRMFSNEGFAPVFAAFRDMGDGMNPVKAGLGSLAEGFDALISRVPDFTRGLLENVDLQTAAREAMERLTGRTGELDLTVEGLTRRLLGVPFEGLEAGAQTLGYAILGLGERAVDFGQNWREVLSFARREAEEAGGAFGAVFGGTIPNMWQGMLTNMQSGWNNAWTGMKQGFHGIINRVVGGMNNLISGLNRFQVQIPAFMGGGSFGFNIPLLPSIPALARGGIVDAPTLALVGERGREAVLPLENNTGWMADLAGIVADAVKGSGGAVDVNLHLDGMKIAQGVVDYLDELNEGTEVYWG